MLEPCEQDVSHCSHQDDDGGRAGKFALRPTSLFSFTTIHLLQRQRLHNLRFSGLAANSTERDNRIPAVKGGVRFCGVD